MKVIIPNMNTTNIREELDTKGFCIIPDVLTQEQISHAYNLFHDWKKTIPNHDYIHNNANPHGIYKYHQAGHTEHAWFIRTRPNVQNVFKNLWNTNELIVSFDGCCYIPKNLKKKDKIWTHSDQAPNSQGLQCIQGFVSLTDNRERTFVAYEGSHKIHFQYFKDKNIQNNKNWNLIPREDVENFSHLKRVLHVPAGALVLWDSRTFHQNQYGTPLSEERVVQYVCFLPKNHPKNTKNMQNKRAKYFETLRTTSHWPAPIKVNGLQPRSYGNDALNIDYSQLNPPNLTHLHEEIQKLL